MLCMTTWWQTGGMRSMPYLVCCHAEHDLLVCCHAEHDLLVCCHAEHDLPVCCHAEHDLPVWPASDTTQVLEDLPADRTIRVVEGT